MRKFLLTMVFNEDLCLPHFLAHYAKYFAPEDIVIIDHGSTVACIPEGYGGVRIPRHKPFSEAARLKLIKNIATGLLEYFDAGVYVDCDELINLDGLDDRELTQAGVLYVAGFDVYRPSDAGPGGLRGVFNPAECKPLVFRKVPDWGLGFHGCDLAPRKLRLPMAHIRFLFREQSARRLASRVQVHDEMQAQEKSRGIDAHWKSGDAEYQRFYEIVAEREAAGAPLLPFTEIDPGGFFEQRRFQPFSFLPPQTHHVPAGTYEITDGLFDLAPHFPALAEAAARAAPG